MKHERRKKKQLKNELTKVRKQSEFLMAALKTSSVQLVDTISDSVTQRVVSEKVRKITGDISELFLSCREDNSVYHEVARLLSAYSGFSSVTIGLCDRSVENIMFIGWAGFPEGAAGPAHVSVNESLSGEAARTGQPVLSAEVSSHQKYSFPLWKSIGAKTLLSVPMKAGKRVVGVLTLGHPDRREIPAKQVDGLQVVANYVGQEVERKQAEEALRESEERFREFFENEPEYCYIVSPEGVILNANKAAHDALGYKINELVGKPLREIYAPECHPKMKRLLSKWKTSGTLRDEEMVIVSKKGEKLTVLLSASAIRDNDGEVLHSVSIQRDITERKKAEEALRQRSHDLQKRVKELNCLYQVGNLLNTPHISLDELVQRTVVLLLPGWQYPSITCARIVLQGTERTTENFRETAWRQSSDITVGSERYGSVEVYYLEKRPELDEGPFLREERNLINAIAEQLGMFLERRRAESEKERMEAQLRQAQKMEAIGRLAGGMAHDFNNLLTAIRGYSDLALMKLPGNGPVQKDVEHIRSACVRAAKLTEQLLLLSRPQPVAFKSLNLNKTVSNLLKMLKRVIGEDFSIVTDLDPVLRTVYADAGHIEQTIMNMVVNAKDAMPEGGEITIRTENVDIDRKYCDSHRYARRGEFIRVSIEDAGVGMDNSTMSHIFEPFFTTKDQKKGTGLGLSIVYGIIRQHKGWADVESTPGEGSTFRIYLPSSLQKEKEESKETSSDQADRRKAAG